MHRLTLAFVFVFALSFTSFGATYFTGNLNSAQEVPPNASTATGFGRVTLNDAETQITASFHWTGLSGNASAGHIHGPAAVGVNGPIIFNMAPAAATAGSVIGATFAVTAQQVADLKAGLWYFNIHTAANSGGEIRGQITVDSPFIAFMNSGQENPPLNNSASGSGFVSLNPATSQALVTMKWSGLSGNATAGHVHSGRSGTNGPVICNLVPSASTSGTVQDFLCTLSAAQITALRQGQLYLNIHTAANPGGEIRGQLQRRRSTVVDFDGDGAADYAIARNNGASGSIEWWIANSSGGVSAFPHGVSGEFNTTRMGAHDFDGDGKDDAWVWRSAASPNAGFVILQSSDFTIRFDQFGTTGDDPRVVYDYDGDGRADPAVFRTSDDTWYFKASSNNAAQAITYVRWGTTFPNPGDFDGDGRGDFLDQQSGVWWLLRSSDLTVRVINIGTGASFGVPGDYDGDGKTDLGVSMNEGTQLVWYYLSSLNPTQNVYLTRQAWGPSASRIRTQGDYDADGKTDVAVWLSASPQQFWVLKSTGGHSVVGWGTTNDFPIAGYNNR
jgi:hypothetical protein